METVNESLTTVEDGDTTVNERLSPGGPGPEGQPDTASESITTAGDEVVDPEPVEEPAETPEPKKTTRKRR